MWPREDLLHKPPVSNASLSRGKVVVLFDWIRSKTRFVYFQLKHACWVSEVVLEKNQADLLGLHDGALPVVQVVVKVAVSGSKLEGVDEFLVVHEIEAVHDVYAVQLSENESIVHELCEWGGSGDVVVAVGSSDFLVDGVAENSGWEDVEGAEVGDFVGGRVFYDVGLDNILVGCNPVLDVLLVEVDGERELLKVLAEQNGDLRDVFFAHLSDSRGFGLLCARSVGRR